MPNTSQELDTVRFKCGPSDTFIILQKIKKLQHWTLKFTSELVELKAGQIVTVSEASVSGQTLRTCLQAGGGLSSQLVTESCVTVCSTHDGGFPELADILPKGVHVSSITHSSILGRL